MRRRDVLAAGLGGLTTLSGCTGLLGARGDPPRTEGSTGGDAEVERRTATDDGSITQPPETQSAETPAVASDPAPDRGTIRSARRIFRDRPCPSFGRPPTVCAADGRAELPVLLVAEPPIRYRRSGPGTYPRGVSVRLYNRTDARVTVSAGDWTVYELTRNGDWRARSVEGSDESVVVGSRDTHSWEFARRSFVGGLTPIENGTRTATATAAGEQATDDVATRSATEVGPEADGPTWLSAGTYAVALTLPAPPGLARDAAIGASAGEPVEFVARFLLSGVTLQGSG